MYFPVVNEESSRRNTNKRLIAIGAGGKYLV